MKKWLAFLCMVSLLSGFQQPHKTWLALGDSITYLNDHTNETDNRVKKGYMTRVTEVLPDIQYINKGFNGWTAVGIAEQIDKLGLTPADIYTVFLGTNDWWSGKPVGTIADFENGTGTGTISGAFRIILDKFHSLNARAKIVLITPMPRTDFVYYASFRNNAWGSYKEKNGQTLEQVVNAIRAIGAHEKLQVVDLYHEKAFALKKLVAFKRLKEPATGQYKNFAYPDYIDIPFNPDADEYPYPVDAIRMTYDGLHPSDEGYALIAKKLVKALRK